MPKILVLMRARARSGTQNIDDDKKEQPDDVNEVPVPRGGLKPEMALRGEVIGQRAQTGTPARTPCRQSREAVKSGRHEKCGTVNMAGKPERRMLIFIGLKNREQRPQSDSQHQPHFNPSRSPCCSAWWAQVTVVPDVSKISVLMSGKCHGSKVSIPSGGQCPPVSSVRAA